MTKQFDNALACLNRALELGYRKAGELEKKTDFDGVRNDLRFTEAVNRARENAFPCMKQKQLREFDFWIGDWTAYVTGTNNIAGYSRIDMASGGCMILENQLVLYHSQERVLILLMLHQANGNKYGLDPMHPAYRSL